VAKHQVTVPDIGGAEGAEVIELLVAVGDKIEAEQGLIVLESDKASMEIPSDAAGTIVELLVTEGQELSEGAAILVLETAGENASPQVSGDVSDGATQAAQEPELPAAAEAVAPAPAAEAPPVVEQVVSVPDIGTQDAVELIEICVAPGDTVSEGGSLVVLESDKASMEVPSPIAGEVVRVLVEAGGSVRQGDELMVVRAVGSAPAAAIEQAAVTEPAVAPSAPVSAAAPARPAVVDAAPATDKPAPGNGVYAGPAVRKLAREFGVDIAVVPGSGPRGRVVKEDLQSFVKTALVSAASAPATGGAGIPAVPEPDYAAFGPVEVSARSRMDKVTAANMQRSWLNVPHVTQTDDADITELEAFRKGLKAEAEKRGTRLTPLPFLLKACAIALRDNPKFRSSLADGGESLVTKNYIHIGMAVDTPAGLLVPVIRDVDQKTLWELAEEVLAMADMARERKLKPSDMQGGCFTISSLGGIGGTGFTPIVNAPEVGILGVSRSQMKPVWDGQAFEPRLMLPLGLSYDHRVINGGDGGRFMSQLTALLGDIRRLLL
jgi:pyruvate dehydrogenase E2 component (dihydrolipoyllysine-residue acetyltransferase)